MPGLSAEPVRDLMDAVPDPDALVRDGDPEMTKPGHRPITLPINQRQDYPVGLSQAILRQAGLKNGRR